MSLRPLTSQNLRDYPKIQIDRGSVIRPCNTDQNAADQFIDRHKSSWRKIIYDAWHEGIPFILHWISTLQVPPNSRPYQIYLLRALKYVAFILLHIHRIYIYIYGYFFPYSLLPLDQVCDEFSRCFKWSEAVIRAFAWHPNHDRCALAICNDYVYVYQGATRIKVARHAQQRKITDLAWQPSNKEILVVATQTNIIIWRISENHNYSINLLNELSGSRGPAYLSPALQLVMRGKEASQLTAAVNGSLKPVDSNRSDTSAQVPTTGQPSDFKIINDVLPSPMISLQFDQNGSKLFACSPNSSKIAILNVDLLLDSQGLDDSLKGRNIKSQKPIEYLTTFGQGFAKLLWSPEKNRLATVTTSNVIRVFEPYSWSHNKWSLQSNPIQDIVWSYPHGRMLLIANKIEPFLYALPFLDNPQAGDVGGNKSVMRALDLTATGTESGELVGGIVHSLVWDKDGKRLAISFKDNSESILLYRTVERPTVEFHQLGVIQSETGGYPLLMQFHDKFKGGSLLTVCWSDGNCQHIPMYYMPNEQTRNGLSINDSFGRALNNSSFCRTLNNSSFSSSFNDPKSPPKTPRSLTNFCHVSGNNSISSFPSSLMPINKVQHQTTLFSLSAKSPLEVSKDSLDSNDDTKS